MMSMAFIYLTVRPPLFARMSCEMCIGGNNKRLCVGFGTVHQPRVTQTRQNHEDKAGREYCLVKPRPIPVVTDPAKVDSSKKSQSWIELAS